MMLRGDDDDDEERSWQEKPVLENFIYWSHGLMADRFVCGRGDCH